MGAKGGTRLCSFGRPHPEHDYSEDGKTWHCPGLTKVDIQTSREKDDEAWH